MTQFARGTSNTALIPIYWSQQLFKESWGQNPFKQYMGTGPENIIQVSMDLTKKQGETIIFKMLCELTGSGQTDDGTYVTNEETLKYRALSLVVHERGNGVKVNGQMTEQSALADVRADAKASLGSWQARVEAREAIDALSGLPAMSFAGQTTGETAVNASGTQIYTVTQVAPTRSATATRYFAGGQTVAGVYARVANVASLDATSHLFGTKVIDQCVIMAKQNITMAGAPVQPIKPIMVDGTPHWLMLIDSYQAKALRADPDWIAAQSDAGSRDLKNPIFSGSMGVWNNVVVRECTLLHRRTGDGNTDGNVDSWFDAATTEAVTSGVTVTRALFLGAQALAIGIAKLPSWSDGYVDAPANTKWSTFTNSIRGMKKFCFSATLESSTDGTITAVAENALGCIICDTAVVI